MSKIICVLVIVALAACVQGFPTDSGDIVAAVTAGDWDKVRDIIGQGISDRFHLKPYEGDVRSLKPAPGGHVFAESDYNFHSTTNNNGQVSSQSGGHKIINDDGKVSEYDYKP